MEPMRRDLLRSDEPPPRAAVRYFYSSTLQLDDLLAPIPQGAGTSLNVAPKPFSPSDCRRVEQAWQLLRERCRHAQNVLERVGGSNGGSSVDQVKAIDKANTVAQDSEKGPITTSTSRARETGRPAAQRSRAESDLSSREQLARRDEISTSDTLNRAAGGTTGTPFIRAPSRSNVSSHWTTVSKGEDADTIATQTEDSEDERQGNQSHVQQPKEKTPVGVGRIYQVVLPDLKLEPIYWCPMNDVAETIRATWFYRSSMLPVESNVANLLEVGYIKLRPWTQTWQEELKSAVDVGALGEEKIVHTLWPDLQASKGPDELVSSKLIKRDAAEDDLEHRRALVLAEAEKQILQSTSGQDADNRACGNNIYGNDGQSRMYRTSRVIYKDNKEAFILRPNLQPSAYYGRRPLANFILKGRDIGIPVIRGFDEARWQRLHPTEDIKSGFDQARVGLQAPTHHNAPHHCIPRSDEAVNVTDLCLVIHGIGQKLSERVESFNFTHSMNGFRREINVELHGSAAKPHLRENMGNIMVLPVNWRSSLSFEEGGYRDGAEDPQLNHFSLMDITPESLPSVRNIVSDVMLDIPYYLSHHQPKMISAVIREANRIYKLFCQHNADFSKRGRVHLIAHSLGSVMAIDILSRQPTHGDDSQSQTSNAQIGVDADEVFHFRTSNLFLCGSPAGFFLLLKRASLRPRRAHAKPGFEDEESMPGVVGEQGDYGCIAVDNVYNIINPYDPVAYKLNPAVDKAYAASLKPVIIPSVRNGWFSFRRGNGGYGMPSVVAARRNDRQTRQLVARLPSQVELETHNFSREEIAERQAYLLNDNGQVDYFMKYGGGPLEIQYLTMLGAHSSYWLSKDFARFIVIETGRELGRRGTLDALKASKQPGQY